MKLRDKKLLEKELIKKGKDRFEARQLANSPSAIILFKELVINKNKKHV